MSSPVEQRIKAVLREIQIHKNGFVASIVVIALIMLAIGSVIPKNYDTEALLYADVATISDQIVSQQLTGRLSLDTIDQAEIAKEIPQTRRFMDHVVQQSGVLDPKKLSKREYERELAKIRENLNVRSKGQKYIEITYTDKSPEMSFEILNAAVDAFIKESSAAKRKESREAFEFVQEQVRSYKNQLDEADNRLSDFRSSNRDGTKELVTARIVDLQGKIEQLQLDIDEANIKARTIGRQLNAEGKYVKKREESEELRKRLASARQRLDNLLLNFTETHPDVVTLQEQIAEMEAGVLAKDVQGISGLTQSDGKRGVLNPLYEELRKQLAAERVKVETSKKRLRASEEMLEQEYARMDRIVGRETELSELTRDYDTMSTIYNNLLTQLESTRMTMTLDAQGRGSSYKIQEPPVFPVLPSGLRFLHFAILGPLIALLAPIGMIYAFVELDPRIRMASVIQEQLRIPVLAVVPHVTTNIRQSFLRSDLLPHFLALALVVVAYIVVGAYKLTAA